MMPLPMLDKPRIGEPCNGCGFCCIKEPCALANEFLSCWSGPCVALEQVGERFVCGLVAHPETYLLHQDTKSQASEYISGLIVQSLGIGRGCDSYDENAPCVDS